MPTHSLRKSFCRTWDVILDCIAAHVETHYAHTEPPADCAVAMVLFDGCPASGKTHSTDLLSRFLAKRGQSTTVFDVDWFLIERMRRSEILASLMKDPIAPSPPPDLHLSFWDWARVRAGLAKLAECSRRGGGAVWFGRTYDRGTGKHDGHQVLYVPTNAPPLVIVVGSYVLGQLGFGVPAILLTASEQVGRARKLARESEKSSPPSNTRIQEVIAAWQTIEYPSWTAYFSVIQNKATVVLDNSNPDQVDVLKLDGFESCVLEQVREDVAKPLSRAAPEKFRPVVPLLVYEETRPTA